MMFSIYLLFCFQNTSKYINLRKLWWSTCLYSLFKVLLLGEGKQNKKRDFSYAAEIGQNFLVPQGQSTFCLFRWKVCIPMSLIMIFKKICLIRRLLFGAFYLFVFVVLKILILNWSICCLSSILATYCHSCSGNCLLRVVTLLLADDQRIMDEE